MWFQERSRTLIGKSLAGLNDLEYLNKNNVLLIVLDCATHFYDIYHRLIFRFPMGLDFLFIILFLRSVSEQY